MLSDNEIKGLPKLLDSDDKPVSGPDLYDMGSSDMDSYGSDISSKDIDVLGKEIGTENLAEKHASKFLSKSNIEPSVNYFNRSTDPFTEESQRSKREHRKKERDLFKLMNEGLRGVYKQPIRKAIADNRPRVKGRFIKTGENKVRNVPQGYFSGDIVALADNLPISGAKGKSRKKTKAQKKHRSKQRTKAKRDVMKARKQLTKALKRYKKVMNRTQKNHRRTRRMKGGPSRLQEQGGGSFWEKPGTDSPDEGLTRFQEMEGEKFWSQPEEELKTALGKLFGSKFIKANNRLSEGNLNEILNLSLNQIQKLSKLQKVVLYVLKDTMDKDYEGEKRVVSEWVILKRDSIASDDRMALQEKLQDKIEQEEGKKRGFKWDPVARKFPWLTGR